MSIKKCMCVFMLSTVYDFAVVNYCFYFFSKTGRRVSYCQAHLTVSFASLCIAWRAANKTIFPDCNSLQTENVNIYQVCRYAY